MSMTAGDCLKSIEAGKWESFLFLFGEERFFQTEIIGRLTEKLLTPDNSDFNYECFDANESRPEAWIESARTLSFFGGQKLIVVRNLHNASLSPEEAERLMAYLSKPLPEACLVITADKIDRKKKLHKFLEKCPGSVDCSPPTEGFLVSWLKKRAQEKGYTLSPSAANLIVERVGNRPGILAQELEKTLIYAGEKKAVSEEDVAQLVGELKMESAFMLIDALKEKKLETALRILKNNIKHGEEPIKTLGLIAWQFRTIWEVKCGLSRRWSIAETANKMGAKPFMVEKAAASARQYSDKELQDSFQFLRQADRELKSTGKNPEGIMKNLLWNLCSVKKD
jgi:DNA polymerase III subunit delta